MSARKKGMSFGNFNYDIERTSDQKINLNELLIIIRTGYEYNEGT